MTDSPTRVGILGFGVSGSVFHAPTVSATPGFELVAVATDFPGHQVKLRTQYPQTKLYSDSEEFFADVDDFDLVVVSVTNNLHFDYGMRLVEAGIPAIVEKPLSSTSEKARKLVAEAQEKNAFLTVFQNRRWDGDFLTVSDIISSGKIGQVARFVSRFEWPELDVQPGWREDPTPGMAGGVMFDLGTHLVDQAVCLFGEVQQVYAEADARRAGAKIDDDSFISLRFANGVLAHLSASKVNAEPQARFHIVGTDGTFTKFGLDPQENQLGTGMRPNLEGYGLDSPPSFGSLVTRQGEFGVPILPGDYRKYYELVRQALISGTKPPVDPNDAVYCLAILEAARHSAIDHAVVELAPRSEYLAGNP